MKVVICGVGNEKGFFSACKGVEHRHRVYGIDSQDLNEIKYQELKPDMVIDCTKYPKESAALKKACEQRHWDYKKV